MVKKHGLNAQSKIDDIINNRLKKLGNNIRSGKTTIPKGFTPKNYMADVKAPWHKQALGHFVNMNLEGVKMEMAMMGPSSAFLGTKDVTDYSPVGGSYSTGMGFYLAGQVIPWSKMWKAMASKGKHYGPWRGLYDYGVSAPINFTVAAKAGAVVNQVNDAIFGNKTWKNFIDENYGDFDEFMKHTISDLVTGFAMKMGHKIKNPSDIIMDFRPKNKRIKTWFGKEFLSVRDLKNEAKKKLED